jgi:hypothetical protein
MPFKFQDKNLAKEEIDRFFANEIEQLEPYAITKKFKKVLFYLGISLFGFGLLKIKLRSFTFEKLLRDILLLMGI